VGREPLIYDRLTRQAVLADFLWLSLEVAPVKRTATRILGEPQSMARHD
jgi:hypothetical protein